MKKKKIRKNYRLDESLVNKSKEIANKEYKTESAIVTEGLILRITKNGKSS